MISEILAMMKVAQSGDLRNLIIVMLCLAWLRERQQVHQLGQKIIELLGRREENRPPMRNSRQDKMRLVDIRRMVDYALHASRDKGEN